MAIGDSPSAPSRLDALVLNSPPEECAGVIRTLLNHESTVIHERMTWFNTYQGFLFAAVGFSWQNRAWLLIYTFCGLGIATTFGAMWAIMMAANGTTRILDWWSDNGGGHYQGPPIMGRPPVKRKGIRRFFPSPLICTTSVFLISWTVIAYANHLRSVNTPPARIDIQNGHVAPIRFQ